METGRSRPSWNIANLDSPFRTVILVCAVAMLCYLGNAYVPEIPPNYIATFWPDTAFLVAVLLLVPRRIWPVLMAAGLGAIALVDLIEGLPIGSTILDFLGNLAEVLVATFGISWLLKGEPHLSSVKTLAKYFAVAVILAPLVSALVGANAATSGGYWLRWRLMLFADALAFLTVTPAILSWVHEGRAWARKSRNYLELAALMISLVFFGYLAFIGTGRRESPALLYSLVPLLLWAALRLGLKGVSTSMVVVALLSIWGAVHGRGPFAEQGPLDNTLSLQLFLFFAAIPFTVLAVLVEEHRRAQQALINEEGRLRESEERFRLAAQAGQMYAYEWDVATDKVVRSEEYVNILGFNDQAKQLTHQRLLDSVHAEDRALFVGVVDQLTPENPTTQMSYRVLRPDGSVVWLEKNARAFFDEKGGMLRIVGMVADITERKRTEEALRESEERLRLAVQAGKVCAFEWNVATDAIVRYGQCANILNWMDDPTRDTGQQFAARVHPDDRWAYDAATDSGLTPENPTYQTNYRMLRPDGSVVCLEENGRAFFDGQGRMLRTMGMAADVTERKRAEEALRESEERLRLAVQAGRIYTFEWDAATDRIVRSGESANILRWPGLPALDTGRRFITAVHPDDVESYAATETGLTPENPSYQIAFRMLRPDGVVIWLEETGRAFFDTQGKLLRLIGMVTDVTERKLAEEALSSVSRRLIEAQEQERARIARELHDDLSQRMALLSISLEQFEQDTAWLSSTARQQLHDIAEVSTEVSSSIHDLSHQLHPSKLDILGLVVSLEGLCREFSGQHNLQVQFAHGDIPGQIPKDVTLCLFRIVQEALQNIVKHSGVTEAQVDLSGHGDGIDLCIADSGVGFSPEAAKGDTGLGLVSMRERLRLVDGQLSVESEPSHGTRIRVHVPLFRADTEGTNEGKTRKAGA